jgi:hypothetical protein
MDTTESEIEMEKKGNRKGPLLENEYLFVCDSQEMCW